MQDGFASPRELSLLTHDTGIRILFRCIGRREKTFLRASSLRRSGGRRCPTQKKMRSSAMRCLQNVVLSENSSASVAGAAPTSISLAYHLLRVLDELRLRMAEWPVGKALTVYYDPSHPYKKCGAGSQADRAPRRRVLEHRIGGISGAVRRRAGFRGDTLRQLKTNYGPRLCCGWPASQWFRRHPANHSRWSRLQKAKSITWHHKRRTRKEHRAKTWRALRLCVKDSADFHLELQRQDTLVRPLPDGRGSVTVPQCEGGDSREDA